MTNNRLTYYFEKYQYKLTGFAINMLGHGVDADDMVADAFVALSTRFDGDGLQEAAVRSYLYLVVKNACLNSIKKHKRHRKGGAEIAYLSDEIYFDAQIVKAELYDLIITELLEAIDKLPVGQRIVFKMLYIDGMKRRDIYEALKIHPGTFDRLIWKAKNKLREQFKGREIY